MVWSKTSPRALTFGELELVARRCAAGFRAMSVRQGDRVVYQLPNCIEAAATYLGLNMLGPVLVLVDEFPRTASGKVQKYVLRDRL